MPRDHRVRLDRGPRAILRRVRRLPDDAGHAGRKRTRRHLPPTCPSRCATANRARPRRARAATATPATRRSSPPGTWSCAKGGCNGAGGACSAQGQGCYCTSDPSCGSGKCVKVTGKNDVSCASCSGSGAAGRLRLPAREPRASPRRARATFGYTPSNLTAQQLAALAPVGRRRPHLRRHGHVQRVAVERGDVLADAPCGQDDHAIGRAEHRRPRLPEPDHRGRRGAEPDRVQRGHDRRLRRRQRYPGRSTRTGPRARRAPSPPARRGPAGPTTAAAAPAATG